jgi:hypothetical protein
VKITVDGWFSVGSTTLSQGLWRPVVLNDQDEYVYEPVAYNGPLGDPIEWFTGPESYTWDQKYAIYDELSLEWWPPLIPPSGQQVLEGNYSIWYGSWPEWFKIGYYRNITTPAEIMIGDCSSGPIADAGPDQIVYEGQEVQFNGSGYTTQIDRCSKNVRFEKSLRVNDAPGKAFIGVTSLALDDNDAIYVAWTDNRSGIGYIGNDIYLSRSLDGGVTFEPNVRVNDDLDDVIQMGVSIAATGVGQVYAVWLDGRNSPSDVFWEIGFDIYFAKSSDGGKTFGNNIKLNEEGGVFHHYLYRPSIAVDTMGNIHVAWHTNKNGEYNIYYSKSTDGGFSFTPNVIVNNVNDAHKRFQVSITTDKMNNVYITWVDYRNGDYNSDIYFSKSIDGGKTFSKNIRVNDDGNTSPPTSYQASPDILVDEDNHVYVVWQDKRNPTWAIYFSKSIDEGITFSKSIRIDDYQGYPLQVGPRLSTDPVCDYIMTVWQDYRDGNYDIYFMKSDKDGQPLSSSVEVSDYDGIAQQAVPSMAVDSLGFVHVVWLDERYPGAPATRDIYYSKGFPTHGNQSQNLSFNWDFNNFIDSNNDGNYTNDIDAVGRTPTHIYGDDGNYTVTLTVTDSLDNKAYDAMMVTVLNLDPSAEILRAYSTADVTLRLAGEKWHDATMYLYENGTEIGIATVVRFPGSPDDQSATIEGVYLDLTKKYSAKVVYTPEDDPVNGRPNGANPAWIFLTFEDGSEERIHHTFNVKHPETWEWNLELNQYLIGHEMNVEASATDPGSDDLTFEWDFGASTIYYNNDISPDPYPSPEGIFPFEAKDVADCIYQGSIIITLTVVDDDNGTGTATIALV